MSKHEREEQQEAKEKVQAEAQSQSAGAEPEEDIAADTETQAPEVQADAEEIIKQLEAATKELEAKYLRALADLENLKRQARKRQEEAVLQSKAELVKSLLPVLDNFERALEYRDSAEAGDSFAKGMELIYQQLCDSLAAAGVEPIDTVGQDFDPDLHEAMGTAPVKELPEGRIVSQPRKGYLLNGRLLRPAGVVVARPAQADESGQPEDTGEKDS